MASNFENRRDPVAVVGIGCRLPGGANGPARLWTLLREGGDAVRPVPTDRWDVDRHYSPSWRQPGRMTAREGGFLDRVDVFDAAFFGISDRVAEQMDPQQRLLLEVCWEALEDAGVVPESLAGRPGGVFVGACSQDYGNLQTSPDEAEGLGAHSATGVYASILANRLSYFLDLRGPSMTIDTACSSSLVAVDLACRSLAAGQSEIALAGGVNVILTPQGGIALGQASMLSPDSRSRAFDASANGYVRGEGAGVVVLKPLSAALRDRDRVYAVITGSAVNQDGRTQGITVPSTAAQEANLRAALAQAGVEPRDVGYVEAHGTGTPVGDPIEATAIGRALAEGRDVDRTLFLGSVKTNIGHLEGGAGIVGLIKAALSIHYRRILPSLHFSTPNPDIDFEQWRMAVPTREMPWPPSYTRAVASVNSFGFGGTNANVVLEQAPRPHRAPIAAGQGAPALLTISAASGQALELLAREHLRRLEDEPADVEELGAALALRRTHQPHRLVIVAADAHEAAHALRGYLNDMPITGVAQGKVTAGKRKVAFLFNGQGPQWHAMGRTLLQTSDVFREKIIECDAAAREHVDWSLIDALGADEDSSPVHRTEFLQPMMFAVQVALAEMWRAWGIEPDGVVGHSMGEIAAAHVSGALDIGSAMRVICRRANIQSKADPTGGMAFVALGPQQARALCARQPDGLWLAAENGPGGSTLSGRREVLDAVVDEQRAAGVFARVLRVACACHSQDMDPLRDQLFAELEGITATDTKVAYYSTVTGALIEGQALSTNYWWSNFREPVLFAPAIRAMIADGFDTFVEISPHPVLSVSVREIVAESGRHACVVASLSRDSDDWRAFLAAAGQLHAAGCALNWRARYPNGANAMDLPPTPWIHRSFWNESAVSRSRRTTTQAHPMITRIDAPRPTWETRWSDHRLTWTTHHEVFGSVLVPGAAHVEAVLAAARELTGERCELEFVEFERPCVLSPDEPQMSRVELNSEDGTFECHCRPVRGETWVRTALGRYRRAPAPDSHAAVNLEAVRERCPSVHEAIDVYGTLREKGYDYGPALCGIERLYTGNGEGLAAIAVPRVLRGALGGYLLHPALLDACFQAAILLPADGLDELVPRRCLLTGFDSVRVHREGVPRWSHVTAVSGNASGLCADVRVYGEDGHLLAEFTGLRGKSVRQAAGEDTRDDLYRLVWQPDCRVRPVSAVSALAAAPMPSAHQMRNVAGALGRQLSRQAYATGYQTKVREICAAYVLDCLRSLGCTLAVGESFRANGFVEVLPSNERAFLGQLRFLVEDGVLSEHDGEFRVEKSVDADAGSLWAAAAQSHPDAFWELSLLSATGTRLAEILTGRADALALLFPGGDAEDVESIYQTSPSTRLYNALVNNAVEHLARTADPRRTIRVLEVGGGTGGLTSHVLPALPEERTEYLFTDVSESFLRRAQQLFGERDWFRCGLLDLDTDLAAQGIARGSFDLVLASDVVHATEDVRATLSRLRQALAPGGVLALIEAEPGSRWLELTFGLTSGWWRLRDEELRPLQPLLPARSWLNVLRSAGYREAEAFGDPDHEGAGSQNVLLARAPETDDLPPSELHDDAAGEWLLVDHGSELGAALARRIEADGGRAIRITRAGFDDPDGQGEPLTGDVAPRGVVYLLDAEPLEDDADGAQLHQRVVASCLSVAQSLRAADQMGARTYILTRGAHSLRNENENESLRLDQAPVWGVGLIARLELPRTRCTMIDLDPADCPDEPGMVWAELRRGDHESEVAFRAGERFTRRLRAVPRHALETPATARTLPEGQRFVLETRAPGSVADLRYGMRPRTAPGAGQVEIEVRAAGVNFLDVMTALDQVPPLDATEEHRFGAECAGIVTRVGPDVSWGVRPGDAVVALVPDQGAIASHVTVDAVHVHAKPENLSFEEAASIPVVFLTAWHTLRRQARLAPGERLLIHSAAGGTGLAAVQIGRLTGAEVFATAGSERKRDFLRSLGVAHVFDSRSPDFAAQVREASAGAGVDVVLSATTGEAFSRSVGCLAPYGRFMEIGKRNALADQRIGLRPFLSGLSYTSFDLRQMLRDKPVALRDELGEVLSLFEAGVLRPLPHRVYHPSRTVTAFRRPSSAQHIGKIVLAMNERDTRLAVPGAKSVEGTWLITGGLGGVGLAMAQELARRGVRHLVLVGRSGARGGRAQAAVERLRGLGVEVVVHRADIASKPAVEDLLLMIERDLPPLRGVLHCAMVLHDGLLTELDESRMRAVTAPKVLGAWHLHQLTSTLPLDAFVMFSSAASMTGNSGQANYAAANTFLDHLAHLRHARGLPALTVNWGVFSDVGYVADNGEVARKVLATGMESMTAARAFRLMADHLPHCGAQVGVLPMNWPQFFRHHDLDRTAEPRYEYIAVTANQTDEDSPETESAGHRSVASRLRARVAAVLGMPQEALDEAAPLMGYLDSLLAVEISTWIERELGAKVTIMELMNGPSIAQLAEQLTVATSGSR